MLKYQVLSQLKNLWSNCCPPTVTNPHPCSPPATKSTQSKRLCQGNTMIAFVPWIPLLLLLLPTCCDSEQTAHNKHCYSLKLSLQTWETSVFFFLPANFIFCTVCSLDLCLLSHMVTSWVDWECQTFPWLQCRLHQVFELNSFAPKLMVYKSLLFVLGMTRP